MKGVIFLLLLMALNLLQLRAQDFSYARSVVDTLCSTTMWGRGYTRDGLQKAANYLASEFHRLGVLPAGVDSYFQPLSYSVNTFPDSVSLSIDGVALKPGIDYLVSAESKSVSVTNLPLSKHDSVTYYNKSSKVILELVDNLVWTPSTTQKSYTQFFVKKNVVHKPITLTAKVNAQYIPSYNTNNVIGKIMGTERPDSILIYTAHYDHLGGMGDDTYFPGANDNASGISLMLQLARHYAIHPLPYTVVFIGFTGEEVGLIGSDYFVKNPTVDLDKVRFLFNIDLAGIGDDGITIVNATEYPKEFQLIADINKEYNFLKNIASRGKAKNSDHYYFTERGVPSFFFYTQGGKVGYHDIYDDAASLPLNEHMDLFKLLTEFNNRLLPAK